MYKNQLQELAQRSCFNLPAYTCIREGPDHAPRFKAAVNFNGETFESPSYCSTLRQAEHSAAEVALNALASRGPSNSLAARILDETGVYKNLLQEVSQRVGASLPAYSTFRTGLGHLPIFTCTVELAGVIFTGVPAKNKKQAEKNAAMAAWLSLKSLVQRTELPYERSHKDEQEHVTVARALQKYLIKARLARLSFPIKFPTLNPRPSSTQPSPTTTSKILPLICPKTAQRNRPNPAVNNNPTLQKNIRTTSQPMVTVPNESQSSLADIFMPRPQKFPAAGAAPYIPVRHCNLHSRIAPPVTIRNTIPVFSAPPLPSPQSSLVMRPPTLHMAPPVSIRQAVPVFAAPVRMDELSSMVHPSVKVEDPRISRPATPQVEEPLFSRAVQGTLDDTPFSKLPPVLVEDPFGYKKPAPVAPISEALTIQVDLPTTEALTVKVKPPVPSAEETTSTEQDKLQEPAEVKIEDLKDLKI
ncbi:double-stranded RNA-binding protein 2-like [Salvia miltiorrhiza]|uniref:double-stranded RNA-binding protein 2-like n=1 Tax=Salvia miltiorrhiza TaxID=226208 RepID=UPI0025ABEDB3|nr:double-stranded RNA-binding protein 2-like [Salvia miltiorrhiza]XP_057798967.1 double-stranded RNA-binding protein 2-like [Salvia miltiorrhiza]XP_057798968.1 double-stranded RNA-binding protein 2-like [Salvia miltiorrhiza]